MSSPVFERAAKQRDALYYPYIHIRGDIRWLKATLLCFPHVLRMVPVDFQPNDSRDVRAFARATGSGGKSLVGRVALDAPFVAEQQTQLAMRLAADLDQYGPAFIERFSRQAAMRDFPSGDSAYQIHREKFLDAIHRPWDSGSVSLLDFLLSQELAWIPSERNARNMWYAVHPVLGEAIMSTIACAVAAHSGLDLVTNDTSIQHALVTSDSDAVYQTLIRRTSPETIVPPVETTDEVVQLVVFNHFDIDRLTVVDIAGLSRDGEGLYELKAAVAEIAARIPDTPAGAHRDQALRDAAADVIEAWQERKLHMSKVARDFFSLGLLDKTSKVPEELVRTGMVSIVGAGTVTASAAVGGVAGVPLILATAPGLVVGAAIYGAHVVAKHRATARESPFRYLSTIEKQAGWLAVARAPDRMDT